MQNDKLIILSPIGTGKTSAYSISLNWNNPLVEKTLALTLTEDALKNQRWLNNFAELKEKIDFLIIYGSIIHSPQEANDIDILGHVNNKVYLDWSEAVSWDHSKFLGVSHKDFQKVKSACVVVKNDIEYLGSLFLNDEVAISTWITKCDYKIKLSRLFQVVRIKRRQFLQQEVYAPLRSYGPSIGLFGRRNTQKRTWF